MDCARSWSRSDRPQLRQHLFNFIHPRPFVSRKPVAEITIKQVVRQTINADTVLQALPGENRQKSVLNEVAASSPKLPVRRP